MNEHEHFEELCALVAAGLASVEEFRDLENHLRSCDECRDRVGDFTRMSAGILSAGTVRDRAHRPPAGMTGRFIARAVAEGIPLRAPARLVPIWASRHPLAWSAITAAGVMLVFLVFGHGSKLRTPGRGNDESKARPEASVPSAAAPAFADRSTGSDNLRRLAAQLNAANAEKENLERSIANLNAAKAEKEHLETSIAGLNDQIRAMAAHDGELAAQIAALEGQLGQMKQRSVAKDAEIADLENQLQRRVAQNADQLASLAESRIQLRDLREQLAERDATILDQRQMLAAGSQARDLIVARNLHIIDVHDNKGGGQRQKAFGRIFYTEGKSIVFYAYDLDSAARLKTQVAFNVWGGRLDDKYAVKNLGVFRNDDAGAGRWVLTFDDPHVLKEINTVFVTAESKKNMARPDGKQILFAYLGDKPNHP